MNIAAVSYLNTAPLIQGLEALKDLTLIRAVPSKIAQMIQSGKADIGLASIVDYAAAFAPNNHHNQPLTLIPAGMIGCDGPTLTVKLLSKVPINHITTIHADTDSHTSIALCDLILQRAHNTKATFINHNFNTHPPTPNTPTTPKSHNAPQTLLIIGDKVVTNAPPSHHYPHQLDLGQAWKQLTNLPFVYATWMCKTSDLDDPHSRANIIAAAHILERTMLKNKSRIDWIVSTHANRNGWTTELAQHYIGNLLRFQVNDRGKQAVETFLAMTDEHNITPPAIPHWLNLSTSNQPPLAAST